MNHSLASYVRRTADALGVFVIHTFSASALYMVLLYLAKLMWALFGETPVGQHYNRLFAERSELLDAFLISGFPLTAFQVMGACLYAGVIITFAGRVLHLFRPFYRSLDAVFRTLLWGVPVLCFATRSLYMSGAMGPWEYAAAFSFFPALAYTRITLRFSYVAVPEIGPLLAGLKALLTNRRVLKR
jgi:hypothetical protein